nr:hypothetical protein [Pseudomonas aeruginosa]
MFYKRHTGDHHSFFVAGQMRYEQARDWRGDPCPARPVGGLLPRPLPPSTPAPTIQQKPADPEQKAIDDKVKQQVAKEEAERKQFCEETRNNLAQLKNNPRVRVDEGKGELRRLGEEERQERIAKAEKAIQENCR